MSLELRGVSVTYGRVEALKQIDLSVPAGQIVALIGANGAGKTTTLRAITGLARLRAGTVTWLGTRLDRLGSRARRRAPGVAMVPEGRRIFPIMSVKDNLLMGAYLRRDSAGIRTDLDRVCARFPRLRERWHQAAGSLSGGEQQMVSVGRALMCRPKLLLLDEPSLGLAPMMVRAIATAILAVNREDGVTILLVEQNSRMALKLSRSAYVLGNGQRSPHRPLRRAGPERSHPPVILGGVVNCSVWTESAHPLPLWTRVEERSTSEAAVAVRQGNPVQFLRCRSRGSGNPGYSGTSGSPPARG